MAEDWSNARKPVNKAINNTTQKSNTINSNNTKFSNQNNKPSGIIGPKKENKKIVFSELINQGVCANCVYGLCKSHQTIDEKIPEILVKYVRSPNYIRNFGEQLLQTNFNI
jgi:hypothetical protein